MKVFTNTTIGYESASTSLGKLISSYKHAATRYKCAAAKHEHAITEDGVATAEDELATAEHELTAAVQELAAAEHNLAATQHEYRATITWDNDACVKKKAKAIVMTTELYDLAIDCLRLSMHFFYPIQHCAQQIYHSALPLSPTTSKLRELCLQSVMDNQLSCVAAFSSPPEGWGLLLRTINVRPKKLTCIATCVQMIVAACENIVDIYDAVTGVLRQSLSAPERVVMLHGSPDGSILFFAHSLSMTMWDVQTGGLIHTFATRSKISDVAVSTEGDHIACGMSDGFVAFWDIHTKEGGGFWNGGPVVTIHWLSPQELAVATKKSLYVRNIIRGRTLYELPIPEYVCGMVYLKDKGEFLVGTQSSDGLCTFKSIKYTEEYIRPTGRFGHAVRPERLVRPALVGDRVVCMASPSGVRLLIASRCSWTEDPPLLDGAISVAVSSNRNLVVQTKDSIQIFTLDVLTSHKAPNDVPPPHIYPLSEDHFFCVQQSGHLTLLKLETLRELNPSCVSSLLGSLLSMHTSQSVSAPASSGLGLIGTFSTHVVKHVLQSESPLPKWSRVGKEMPLGKISPDHTWLITVHSPPLLELYVGDLKHGSDPIPCHTQSPTFDLQLGRVYNITFDSETSFHLKVEGPGWHVQIPFDIVTTSPNQLGFKIIRGEPIPLSEPRETALYTLDTNCEWVLDVTSRKVCWIPPGNIRRGSGGYFWAGLSLVMAGEDGVVRKLTFREPDC